MSQSKEKEDSGAIRTKTEAINYSCYIQLYVANTS